MKLLKQMLVGAALVTAAFGAQATTTTNTNIINLGTLSIGDNYLSGHENQGMQVSKGSFSDIFNFSLTGKSSVDAEVDIWSLKNIHVDASTFSYSLFSGTNLTALASGTDSNGFANLALHSGSYHLDVTGNATGSNGGEFNGVISVSPVPEAGTSSMMLLGLGLMSFIARRRRAD